METLREILQQEETISFVASSLAIGAIYDHLITLDREVELIWKRPKWTVVQFLYLTARYLSDAILIYGAIIQINNYITRSSEGCRNPFLVVDWGFLVAYWASQGIMVFRVSSMYDHDRRIIFTLLSAFSIEIIITSVMNGLTTESLLRAYHMTIFEPLSRCLPALTPQRPTHFWTFFWVPIMIFEIIILVLSIYRGMQYRSTMWTDSRTISTVSGRTSIIYILLRDSLLFPFAGLCICFLNFIGSIYFSFTATQICIIIAGFSTQILGSRLVLNLREAYYQPFEDEFSLERMSSLMPIEFTEPPSDTGHYTEPDV